ncbi:MAG TPA: tetratricopeptide repeat protein [Blastocatellia bacterium]|jgi:tetratricopeptide (TPR) repeat protein|nr:tetratricopeptide repeat protein [Blastocatellia bacterium]
MSDTPLAQADPFVPAALDEQTELRALARALQLAKGFKLIFAQCNQPQQRERLIRLLKEQLSEHKIEEIHFSEPTTHLLDSLRERLSGRESDALFISGIEYSLPVASESHVTSFVANLNAARNSFPNLLSGPLVLWVPEYVLTAIARGAPDFFSIRSGIYFFAATPGETADFANTLIAGSEWSAWNLTLTEKQERIAAIESLLADYEALPPDQRNYWIELRLHLRLGILLHALGAYSSAQQHFEKSLRLAIELPSLEGKGIALNALGNVYFKQARIEEAQKAYQQSLEIAQELGQRGNEARVLRNLGIIYFIQGDQERAEESYKQSLEMYQNDGDLDGKANAHASLGNVYMNEGKVEDAEREFQEALLIAREIDDQASEGHILRRLGNIFFQQGRLEEVNNLYLQSLEISRKLGYADAEGSTLYDLAVLRGAEGRIPEALEFARQSIAVWERIGNIELLELVLKLVITLEKQLQEQSNLVSSEE